MRNWERFVADRLARARLSPDVQQEVVAEIAAHLEECQADLVLTGVADAEARTLLQVSDWNALGRDIRRAKEDTMSIVRKVLIPGAAATITALATLKLFIYLLIRPGVCPGGPCPVVSADGPAYLPWLATLPLAGALAAALARRQDARPIQRLIASIFPAFYLAGEFFVLGLLSGGFFWRIPVYWVLLPALACALGAWPFLGRRGTARREFEAGDGPRDVTRGSEEREDGSIAHDRSADASSAGPYQSAGASFIAGAALVDN